MRTHKREDYQNNPLLPTFLFFYSMTFSLFFSILLINIFALFIDYLLLSVGGSLFITFSPGSLAHIVNDITAHKKEVLSSQRLLFRAEITGNDVQEFCFFFFTFLEIERVLFYKK